MCYQETKHWSCNCLPVTYSNQCRENPFNNVELCSSFSNRQSAAVVPCNDCTAWPTPPSSPSAKIRQLKNVFEAPAVKNDPPPAREYSRGARHRRESVGRLEDKCTECRIWGLPCDMKEPHYQAPAVEAPVLETPITTITEVPETEILHTETVPILPTTKEDYSAHHKATDESLADLKKNIRGLRAALTLLENEKKDLVEEEEVVSKPESVIGFQEFTTVSPFLNTFPNKPKELLENENASFPDAQDNDTSLPYIKQDESSPSPFLPTEEALAEPVALETLNSPITPLEPLNELPIPELVNDTQFRQSLKDLNITSRKVRTAAQNAYKKLKTVARTKKTSIAFQQFVESLESLDNILRIGSQTYEMLLDQQTPHSLIEIYCFLHFAYAMSQGDTDLLPKSSEEEYHRGLLVLRSCLPSTPEYDGLQSQQDIFDEIAHHMAHELECALRWAKKQNLTPASFQGLSLEDVLRLHSERENSCRNAYSNSVMQASNVANIALFGSGSNTSCTTIDALTEIQSLRVFNGISTFLTGLNHFGSPFKLFSGEFCKSISSDIYKHPLYSKSFRHQNRLFDADELRNAIYSEVLCNFDGTLIGHDSVYKILATSLEMLDLGSLITLEDYVDYARGLIMVVLVPLYIVKRFEDELILRCQSLVQKLPGNLLRRVQWPEYFSAPPSPVIEFTPQNTDYIVNMTYVQPELDMSALTDQYYPVTLPEPLSSPTQCSQPQLMEYELSPTLERSPTISNSSSDVISTPPTSSYSEAGDSPKSYHSSPTQSLVCRTCHKTFTNKSNLARHERTKHTPGSAGIKKMLRCPIPGCKTMLGSARAKENMRTHLKKKHGIERPGMEEVRWRVDVLQGCV
ncbi:hypothetical protein AA313_de0201092 [Arthrobotrys entomopaga]|nr:hypothetical protein AA313_de0201092 [Arthrobotrys entomopaga]